MTIKLTQEIGRHITAITGDIRQTTFLSDAFLWLCKEKMRFLSTTPWSRSKPPLQPFKFLYVYPRFLACSFVLVSFKNKKIIKIIKKQY